MNATSPSSYSQLQSRSDQGGFVMPPLLRSLLKRIGWGLVTLWGVSVIAFLLVFVAPRASGIDPAVNLAGNRADEETLKNIRADLGLDKPLLAQNGLFVK